jgi:hypothetical protein
MTPWRTPSGVASVAKISSIRRLASNRPNIAAKPLKTCQYRLDTLVCGFYSLFIQRDSNGRRPVKHTFDRPAGKAALYCPRIRVFRGEIHEK